MTAVDDQEAVPQDAGTVEPKPRRAWRRQYWVALLAIYCVGFAVYGALPYTTLDVRLARTLPPRPGLWFQYPLLVAHILTGVIAVCLAWTQVWPWLRTNHPKVHRVTGRIFFFAGAIPSGLLSIPTALLTSSGQSVRMALLVLGVLWLSTSFLGLRAVLRHRYVDHRKWMLRNVALTTVIITSRPIWFATLAVLQWLAPNSYPPRELMTTSEAVALWSALVLHLVIVEWFIVPRLWRRPAPRRLQPVN